MAPLFWLAYQTAKSRRVVIVRASHLIAARLRAAPVVEGIEDVAFVEGHELPPAAARKVPAGMIGKLLTAAEAESVLDAMEG